MDSSTIDIFVSYASADRDRVFGIVDTLEELGLSIWIDRTGIAGGTAYGAEIVQAIKGARVIALMCTAASLNSKNVRQEIMLGWKYGTPMLPLLLEPVSPPDDVSYWLEGFRWIDLHHHPSGWLSEVVHGLNHLGLAVELTAPEPDSGEGAGAVRSNLPATSARLFGRDQAIAEVSTLLEHGRWITLTGTGGTGKTSLALEVARRQMGRFPDGVWVVDLAPFRDHEQVLPAIIETLGIEGESIEGPLDVLSQALTGKTLMLVLDNVEHLTDGASVVAALQERLPGLTVLATSRIPLKTPAEWVFEVPPLPLPEGGGGLPAVVLAQNPAVALFVERATAVSPNFVLSEGNSRAVAEICARLDGLPLAIELAAARVRLLPPAVLLARLGSRLSLLTRGGGVTGRQKTLIDTIDWSYDLLAPDMQQLFRHIGVLQGESTIAAVQAVTGREDLFDDLQALTEHNLVRMAVVEQEELPRVALLETIREYALLRLEESGELDAARAAQATYYAAGLRSIAADTATARSGNLVALLLSDEPNLISALDWLEKQNEQSAAMQMLADLHGFWVRTGRSREAANRLESALQQGGDLPAGVEGQATYALARIQSMLGNPARAEPLFERAAEKLADAGDFPNLALLHIELGRLAERSGNLDEAAVHFEAAVGHFGSASLPKQQAEALHELGVLQIYRGDLPAAVTAIGESVDAFRAIGDIQLVAEALSDLGAAEMTAGNADAAQKHLQDSLSIVRTLGNDSAVAVLTTNLGRAQQRAGHLEEARATLAEALRLTRQVGDRSAEAVSLYALGLLHAVGGAHDEALPHLRAALSTAWEIDDQWLLVQVLEAFALLFVDQHEDGVAARLFGRTMAAREEMGTSINPADADRYNAAIARARAQLGDARFDQLLDEGKSTELSSLVTALLTAPRP
ncbi:MAG: TIR domain-containing protein [Thermomicrobiales bacterium]|nr:TIR domain-containing protein [Thermomicrobiales bacterium]